MAIMLSPDLYHQVAPILIASLHAKTLAKSCDAHLQPIDSAISFKHFLVHFSCAFTYLRQKTKGLGAKCVLLLGFNLNKTSQGVSFNVPTTI